jgi:mediator of RNA polymerase II transcription subunit 31
MEGRSSTDEAGTGSIPSAEERFLIELEFVQNLANPKYLNYLAQNGYFEQESFMSFLRYLRYWKEPQYITHIIFPQCLTFLDAVIDNADFRRELALPQFVDYVHQQQGSHWMFREAL